jgi:hypothetical protein
MPRSGPGEGYRPPVAAEHVFHAPWPSQPIASTALTNAYAEISVPQLSGQIRHCPRLVRGESMAVLLRRCRLDVHLVDVKATSKPATRRLREECSFDLHLINGYFAGREEPTSAGGSPDT